MSFYTFHFILVLVLSLNTIAREEDVVGKCDPGWYEVPNQICIYVSTFTRDWLSSQISCEDLGGYLAEPIDDDFNNILTAFARSIFDDYDYVWIGGTDVGRDGVWRWAYSGINITTTFWHSECPRDSTAYDCINLYTGSDYLENWIDFYCTEEYYFICQKPVYT